MIVAAHLPAQGAQMAGQVGMAAQMLAQPMQQIHPARVRLIDGKGRQFEPVTLTEPIVRKMYPEVAERPRCSVLAFADAKAGTAVRMAESFIVPAEARDLSLRIEYPGASDETLVFKWTRS